MQTKKESVFTNLIWRFAERCGAQVVQFVVSIILARLLMPEDYGLIAIVLVFTNLLQVFVDSGLGNALIQKKEADDLDFSSVFYFNICVCLILYVLLFLLAPLLADFYNQPELTTVTRVLGLSLIISGLKNVQQAYISRTMQFKKFFFAAIGGTLTSAVVGIIMAYAGFGVWALVAQKLASLLINTVILWIAVKWKPLLVFSFARLKGLISYGWKLLVSALVEELYKESRTLVIGGMYSKNDLAYYNQGNQIPKILVSNINIAIDSILFPVLSQEQGDKDRVKSMTRRAMKTSVFIMAPMMVGLAITAPQVVTLLLTEKWIECVPFLQIACFTYLFYPVHTANLNAIKALGRSDLFLKLEIVKKIVGISLLLISMRYGVLAIASTSIITTFTSQIINSWPNRKLLNYTYFEQFKDILPYITLAVFMGVCVSFITYMNLSTIMTLVLQVALGIIIYISGAYIFKLDTFYYLLSVLKSLLKKRT